MPNPFYWAGNEHNLLFPWVFHAVRSMSERATVQMTLADRGGPRMGCRMARRRLAGPIDRTTGRASCSTAAIRTSRAACQVRPGSGRPPIVHADHSSSFALALGMCCAGNDDYGTMSAWFAFTALGFYPLTGHDFYFVGSPLVSQVRVLHERGGEPPKPRRVHSARCPS